MTAGPAIRPISKAVMAAITARKVMYWKTRRNPNSGPRDCSQLARLSSIRRSSLLLLSAGAGQDGLDDAFHLHEAGTLDHHAGRRAQRIEHGGVQRVDVREVAPAHRRRLLAEREQVLDPA